MKIRMEKKNKSNDNQEMRWNLCERLCDAKIIFSSFVSFLVDISFSFSFNNWFTKGPALSDSFLCLLEGYEWKQVLGVSFYAYKLCLQRTNLIFTNLCTAVSNRKWISIRNTRRLSLVSNRRSIWIAMRITKEKLIMVGLWLSLNVLSFKLV